MKIWILQTGEPLDIDNDDSRPMRAMNLSSFLVNRGHRVVLWSSAFHHRDKRHRSREYKIYNVSKDYQIRLIPSPGYEKNKSIKRFWDHIIMGSNLKKILKKEIDTPDVAFTETDEASSPEMENEIASPSASSPVNVPIAVRFSSILNVSTDVIVGVLSLILLTLIVISCVVILVPSLTVIVAV